MRDNYAIIRDRDGGNQHVHRGTLPARRPSFRHELRPYQGGILPERKYTSGKIRQWSLYAKKPGFEISAFTPQRHDQNTALNFSDRRCPDEKIVIYLSLKPPDEIG